MGIPEIDPILRTKVTRLKEAHLRRGNRMASALGAWFFAGIVVGLTTWFIQNPLDRDSIMFGGVSGLGLAIFFIGGMLTRMLIPKPDTKCPQCGHDWKGSDPNDDWLSWKCCPGCGLKMSDDTGWHEKP